MKTSSVFCYSFVHMLVISQCSNPEDTHIVKLNRDHFIALAVGNSSSIGLSTNAYAG